MARYRVRDVERLRSRMQTSQRIVPHSVRSLAKLVGKSPTQIGYLLTGDRSLVDEKTAQGIAVALGASLDDLFLPASSTSMDGEERETA